MKALWACVLVAATALAQSQPDPKAAPPSLADLGIVYPLSPDWVLATTLIRKQAAARNSSGDSVLLAAVYVPEKKTLSESSPFFSLRALRQTHPDCQEFLDAMAVQLQTQGKTQIKTQKQGFSAGGKDFYRTDFEQKGVLRHRSFICTTAKDYVLMWSAGSRDDNGLEAVISTLNTIALAAPKQGSAAAGLPVASAAQQPSQGPGEARSASVASGIMGGLLVKKVAPVYPAEARTAYIQGTVRLNAEINKEGDIANLELLDGPIELVGSAVNAVRKWKYRPYLMNGEPVAVKTEIQVNYQLSR